MSATLDLPHLERGALLPEVERAARLRAALPQLLAALEGETDAVAIQATLSCLLFEAMPHAHWCGFYRRVAERTLAVGPYQGTMGCLRIDFARGVCGACARSGETQLVPDVTKVDHIACDSRTQSEVVVPVYDHGRTLRAVLDIDSNHLAAFSRAEAELLEELVRVFAQPSIRF